MKYPKYPAYKESGVEWLGEIPEHWSTHPLKRIADVRLSNIDKHSVEGQQPVDLCNYVDVYKNERITNNFSFMRATASDDQITRLSLKKGDVIITKDSETPDDIGVPALVDDEFDGVVCGYHLALLRPISGIGLGAYIHRTIQSTFVRSQFSISAMGMTRYGLGKYSIENAVLPLPPVDEQRNIAAFLDAETAQIDTLIAKQERLIALLQEKRQALISHAVTKGLNPDAPLKDSGVEWLGEVPAHWEIKQLKHYFEFLDSRRIPLSAEERSYRQGEYPYYGASGIIDYIDDFIFDEPLLLIGEDGANLLNRSTTLAFIATGKYWVNNHAHILKPKDSLLSFWAYRLEQIDYSPWISGSAQPKLTADSLAKICIATPSDPLEKSAIADFLDQEAGKIDILIEKARAAIERSRERRITLISAAVTGKIDVRAAMN